MTIPNLADLTPEARRALLERILKLDAKAKSAAEIGSQHEAEAFAAAVSKMLNLYQLEMSDVEYEVQSGKDPIAIMYYSPIEMKLDPAENMSFKHRIDSVESLIGYVAEANNCEVVVCPGTRLPTQTMHVPRHVCWAICGRKTAVDLTAYQFTVLGRTMYKLSAQAYNAKKRELKAEGYSKVEMKEAMTGFYASFYLGFARAIGQRLRAMREELKREATGAANSTALMRLSNELTLATKARDEHFKKLVNLGALQGGQHNADAYHEGRKAGNQQNLGQTGVGTASNKSAGQLGSGK